MMRDLFGNEVSEADLRRKTPLPKGHIYPPGTGPKNETCKTCLHYTIRTRYPHSWRKCGLNRANWTSGPGSDIRAKDPACKFWEPVEQSVENSTPQLP